MRVSSDLNSGVVAEHLLNNTEPLTRRDQFWFRAIEYATVPFFLVYIAGFFGLIE
jgi:hypothetical protein